MHDNLGIICISGGIFIESMTNLNEYRVYGVDVAQKMERN